MPAQTASVSQAPCSNDEHPRSGDAIRKRRQALYKMIAHKQRCRATGLPSNAEVARMVAEYCARGGQVTVVATAHSGPIQNGAGRDADRWTT